MIIHHIKLTKKQLDLIPENERYLLILIGHASNEFNLISKLFHFTMSHQVSSEHELCARNAQGLFVGRLLTGKLSEFWKLMLTAFYGSKVSKEYVPEFNEESKNSLNALKEYFKKENLIDKVRNKYSFHYSLDQVISGYESVPDEDTLSIYLSDTYTNTLYDYADTIVSRSMFNLINDEDHQAGFSTLVEETSAMVKHVNIICTECLSIAIAKHLGKSLDNLDATKIDLGKLESSNNVSIPYFVDTNE